MTLKSMKIIVRLENQISVVFFWDEYIYYIHPISKQQRQEQISQSSFDISTLQDRKLFIAQLGDLGQVSVVPLWAI